MVLSRGMSLEFSEALEQYQEFADQDYYSDLADSDDDHEFASMPQAFEQVVPRRLKRTYGVLVDGVVPDRRLKSRIDEQLEVLRSMLPYNCTDEKASVLTDAYKYIEKLQRQVTELHCALDTYSSEQLCPSFTDRHLDSTTSTEASTPAGYCSCPHPKVEVISMDEGLKIHIECDKRPGLLVDIMELLELNGLNLEQANIACLEHLSLEALSLEMEQPDADNPSSPKTTAKDVRASLVLLIADERIEDEHP